MARLLVNPVCEVVFAGWKSDTYTLGHNGWDVAIEENLYDRSFDMMLYHEKSDIKMLARSLEHPIHERMRRGNDFRLAIEPMHGGRNVLDGPPMHGGRNVLDGPPFGVVQAWQGKGVMRVMRMPDINDWSQTAPSWEEADIMETPLFKKRTAPVAEQLIVEPQDVQQLLEQIKRMQSPEQAQLRHRAAREIPVAQATIISFGT